MNSTVLISWAKTLLLTKRVPGQKVVPAAAVETVVAVAADSAEVISIANIDIKIQIETSNVRPLGLTFFLSC